jgi:hypothetical protein
MGNSNIQSKITYKSIKKENHSILGLIDFIEVDVSSDRRFFTSKLKSFLDRC